MELDLSRVRRPSRRFGWVDRRVLTEDHLAPLGPIPVALYLVLCIVADRHGISWYARGTLAGWVKCPVDRIHPALERLVLASLVALADRYVQVLDLDLLIPAPAASGRLPVVRNEPAAFEPPSMTAHEQLEQLPPDLRKELLNRARSQLVRFTGGQEPRRSALEAVAVGLIERGAA